MKTYRAINGKEFNDIGLMNAYEQGMRAYSAYVLCKAFVKNPYPNEEFANGKAFHAAWLDGYEDSYKDNPFHHSDI